MEFKPFKRQATLKKSDSENKEDNADISLNAKRSAESSPDLSNKKRPILGDITNAHKNVTSKPNSKNSNELCKSLKTSVSSLEEPMEEQYVSLKTSVSSLEEQHKFLKTSVHSLEEPMEQQHKSLITKAHSLEKPMEQQRKSLKTKAHSLEEPIEQQRKSLKSSLRGLVEPMKQQYKSIKTSVSSLEDQHKSPKTSVHSFEEPMEQQHKSIKTSVSSLEEPMDQTQPCDEVSPIQVGLKALPQLNLEIFNISPVPDGVEDFDDSNKLDVNSESKYAPCVFAYYKEREKHFVIEKYMPFQTDITKGMRACLVDWLVEVQESFELNHETLYLAVKLVDFYLMRHKITKASLQLVGATSMLIASKYDERIPPVVDDFLYICDDSYSRVELLEMEESILKTVNFDLGIPLSYRFLRRYARCTRASMETLTLARYILETCLMDYELIDRPDSKMAAASFLLAIKMKNMGEWTPTLQYYSGYKEEELEDLVKIMNRNISITPNKNLITVRTKYSHRIFFEVAKIQPLAYPEDVM